MLSGLAMRVQRNARGATGSEYVAVLGSVVGRWRFPCN
jgi:hypothetical protein